jgi:putative aminopeptidase FrvX
MIENKDVSYCVDQVVALCRVPSPSGYTAAVEELLFDTLAGLGLGPMRTRKRSVICDLGGVGRPLLLAAHVDTLGAMVRSVKDTGRIRFTPVGGYPEIYIVTETCVVHTRDGRRYTGTFQPVNPSVHVNKKIRDLKPEEESIEVVLDEAVSDRDDVAALGVRPGDFISIDPRTTVTDSGYIKSRHLDDKASAGILLGLARLASQQRISLGRKVYILFTTYEEVGHGASAGVPGDVEEMISVDMGAVGDDLSATEHQVSICAKDSGGPYNYQVTGALIESAEAAKADFAVDIYPKYGSDVSATLRAGYDIAHGLIGPGVSASHGYERTHIDGLENTLKLLAHYVANG